jgi:hypothetical protein
MSHRCLLTVLYALHLFWTGLWRSIEAHAFKPNAFYFCLTFALIALAGAYLYRIGKDKAATAVTGVTVLIVLAFYIYCFVTNAAEDASFRVALIIITSVAELVVISFPPARQR